MVQLITKANGVAAMLFHVAQSDSEEWWFRWRITGPSHPESYLAWREEVCRESRAIIHPEISGCQIEVEWRESAEAPWSQVALRQCGTGKARFLVRALHDFISPQPFRVMAEVAGRVACYLFAPLELYAGCETSVVGEADGPYPENVLLAPRDFQSGDAVVRFENIAPSEDSLLDWPDMIPRLTAIPGAHQRRLFAVRSSPSLPATPERV